MNKVREIIFFSNGSADDASTWSNIPFLFSRELERQGIFVHKVNLSNRLMALLWEKCVRRPLKLLMKPFHTEPVYYGYSWLAHWLAEKKIQKAVSRWSNADYCFFIGYQHANRFSSIPSLLLSDWTTDVTISLKKLPLKRYKDCIQREHEAMRRANYVVSIFQLQAEKMQKEVPEARVCFLGGNVINSFYDGVVDAEAIIKKKSSARRILFIGRKTSYLDGARVLIEAVKELHLQNQSVELDIIGIRVADFSENLPSYVRCHGFLHKDVEEERKLYYKLLMEAAVLVNATPKWAAYSSTIEAMFFYTPVVVSPYQEFQNEFGTDITFGKYNHVFNAGCLSADIDAVLNDSHYSKMCLEAHHAVGSYTWEKYVHKILDLIKEKE